MRGETGQAQRTLPVIDVGALMRRTEWNVETDLNGCLTHRNFAHGTRLINKSLPGLGAVGFNRDEHDPKQQAGQAQQQRQC